MLEKEIEKYLVSKIKLLGGIALKFTSPGFTGVPDRLCILPKEIIFFVELKSPGKNLQARQLFVKKQFEFLGAKVFKIDTKLKVIELCNMYQDIIKNTPQSK